MALNSERITLVLGGGLFVFLFVSLFCLFFFNVLINIGSNMTFLFSNGFVHLFLGFFV